MFSVFEIIKWPCSPSENLKSSKPTNYWAGRLRGFAFFALFTVNGLGTFLLHRLHI